MEDRTILEQMHLGKTLTPTEQQVLQLLSNGYTTQEAADLLNKSQETVKSQVRILRAKLKADNVTHAVAIGIREGVIE
jgi:DNA-binding CsgD family transcriptional regulator